MLNWALNAALIAFVVMMGFRIIRKVFRIAYSLVAIKIGLAICAMAGPILAACLSKQQILFARKTWYN